LSYAVLDDKKWELDDMLAKTQRLERELNDKLEQEVAKTQRLRRELNDKLEQEVAKS